MLAGRQQAHDHRHTRAFWLFPCVLASLFSPSGASHTVQVLKSSSSVSSSTISVLIIPKKMSSRLKPQDLLPFSFSNFIMLGFYIRPVIFLNWYIGMGSICIWISIWLKDIKKIKDCFTTEFLTFVKNSQAAHKCTACFQAVHKCTACFQALLFSGSVCVLSLSTTKPSHTGHQTLVFLRISGYSQGFNTCI